MEAIFNMFKVRYAKLDELIMKHCKEINRDSTVNLFINLEPIMRKLATANIDEYLRVKNEEKSYEMISNIINLASHYRLFFTKNKIYSKIYMYLGYPFNANYKNRLVNPKYRESYKHKYTKDPKTIIFSNTMDHVLPIIKIILEYVEGVYLIESDIIEPSVVPDIITQEFPSNSLNFMITTDRYDYQYAVKGFYIIRPKKESSYMVTEQNLIQTIKLEDKIVNEIEVGNNFFPFILSLLGDKNRSIGKIKRIGLSSVIKMIDKAVEESVIGRDVSNINILSNIIKEEFRPLVLQNYYCTDVDAQMQMLNIKDKYHITSQVTDKFDNVALKKINDEFFRSAPIYLLELTQANNLLRKTKRKDIFL